MSPVSGDGRDLRRSPAHGPPGAGARTRASSTVSGAARSCRGARPAPSGPVRGGGREREDLVDVDGQALVDEGRELGELLARAHRRPDDLVLLEVQAWQVDGDLRPARPATHDEPAAGRRATGGSRFRRRRATLRRTRRAPATLAPDHRSMWLRAAGDDPDADVVRRRAAAAGWHPSDSRAGRVQDPASMLAVILDLLGRLAAARRSRRSAQVSTVAASGSTATRQRTHGTLVDAVHPQPQRALERPRRLGILRSRSCGSGTWVPLRKRRDACQRACSDIVDRPRRRRRGPSLGCAFGATSHSPRRSTFITAMIGPRHHDRRATTCAIARWTGPPSTSTRSRSIGSRTARSPRVRAPRRCPPVAAAQTHDRTGSRERGDGVGVGGHLDHAGRDGDLLAPVLAAADRHGAADASGRSGGHADDTVGDDAAHRAIGDLAGSPSGLGCRGDQCDLYARGPRVASWSHEVAAGELLVLDDRRQALAGDPTVCGGHEPGVGGRCSGSPSERSSAARSSLTAPIRRHRCRASADGNHGAGAGFGLRCSYTNTDSRPPSAGTSRSSNSPPSTHSATSRSALVEELSERLAPWRASVQAALHIPPPVEDVEDVVEVPRQRLTVPVDPAGELDELTLQPLRLTGGPHALAQLWIGLDRVRAGADRGRRRRPTAAAHTQARCRSAPAPPPCGTPRGSG